MRVLVLFACLVAGLPAAIDGVRAQEVRVQVSGEVRHPGEHVLPASKRFADAALAAGPTMRAYPLGAAVLRPAAEDEQRRLKAGLLHDLEVLATFPDVMPEVAARADALRGWIDTLPVTGRMRVELDPRRLEMDPAYNRRLASGDRFVYPPRPATVQVVGAVAAPCILAHLPLRDAAGYLRDCIPAAGADRDLLYAIQPDGEVQRLGIALWNRSAPQALAPGAVLYVPLDERALRGLVPDLNEEVAQFIATQTLPVAAP
ncbi:capsule biosynthesis GfcC family protein [Pseudoxanthomonas suwonensis]|uniref:Uncharacterized protein n=1 Tax=Pseudoxanthomonas suwonensis TaxID=314722 RepID=A0A0E3Z1P0_9GAMM|nr:capsule biosynthesis GfcC family protein [Pseudoxanthomonas suwonensis]AKC86804.1 hypothetical protein WQ53_08580 [Pseudoxanthomonas suwonensis]